MSPWHSFILPVTHYFRQRRLAILREWLPELFDDSDIQIVDLGGSRHFWAAMDVDLSRKHVTIYNISATETGHAEGPAGDIPIHIYDGMTLPLPDAAIDLIVCNSVIEHVPVGQRRALVTEMRRVARKVFLQTPARAFPIEPHFVMPVMHWLPRSVAYRLVFISPWFWLSGRDRAVAREYFYGTQLLNRAECMGLAADSTIVPERVLGLTKSYLVFAGAA